MLEVGWQELLLIAVVALVVIGPKDLPRAMYTAGKWMRKAKMLTRDIQGTFDQMIREAELEEVRREAQELKNLNVRNMAEKAIDPTGDMKKSLDPVHLDMSISTDNGPSQDTPETDGQPAKISETKP